MWMRCFTISRIHKFIEFIILLYTFFSNFFCVTWQILFSNFLDILPAFTWASAISNPCICLGVNILSSFSLIDVYLTSDAIAGKSFNNLTTFYSDCLFLSCHVRVSVRLQTKWLWVRFPLQSLKLFTVFCKTF